MLNKLDFGNALLVGLPAYLIRRLQAVQNASARLIHRLRRFDSDVNKDLTLKAKAKDSGFKAKAKDPTFKAKAKDSTFKAKAKDFRCVLKDSSRPRTKAKDNNTGVNLSMIN